MQPNESDSRVAVCTDPTDCPNEVCPAECVWPPEPDPLPPAMRCAKCGIASPSMCVVCLVGEDEPDYRSKP